MSSREIPPSASWTYRMEVSPTGHTAPTPAVNPSDEPIALLQALISLQSQTLETQKQILQNQTQQLELAREAAQIAREQRARVMSELERWQTGHESVLDQCRDSLAQLEQVHASLMEDLVDHVSDNQENLLDSDFALTDFVDRFGPRLAHLNTMLAVLRPLAFPRVAKPEGSQ